MNLWNREGYSMRWQTSLVDSLIWQLTEKQKQKVNNNKYLLLAFKETQKIGFSEIISANYVLRYINAMAENPET